MELSADTWRSVLDAAGETARLPGQTLTHADLWTSLNANAPDKELYDALDVIHELGTDSGRDLLAAAADDQQVALEAADDVPARELAARIWIQSRSDALLANVLVRARVRSRETIHPRTFREFAGKTAMSVSIDAERLKLAISEWCQLHGQTEAIEVFAHEQDGYWRCEVLRGDALKRVIEVRQGRPAILDFRPMIADHVRYDAATGRLGIATLSPRLLKMFRAVLGTHVAGDADFFGGENICSLRPLQDKGHELFDTHVIPGILRVDVTELHWRRGDRDQFWVRGRDCFKILRDLGARLTEGVLMEAKLSVTFAGGKRGTVSLKVPNRIDIKAGASEALVEWLLDDVGIRGTFDESAEPHTFWSLYPWRLSEQEWRRHLGHDFDRLLREQALRPVTLETATHPDHPSRVRALQVESADANVFVGLSDDPAIGMRTLTRSDVAGYEINIASVGTAIGVLLGVEGPASELSDGLWSLGRRVFTPAITVAVFLASRQPAANAAALVRASTKGTHTVLLVPHDCTCAVDLPTVPCRLPIGPYETLMGRIVKEVGLEDSISPELWAHEDLILDCNRATAWFRGVELTGLKSDTQPFRFAVEVAMAQGSIVTKQVLNAALSPSRDDEEAAKKAKLAFTKAVKASFVAAGRPWPTETVAIFGARGGGYALNTTARVLS
jgi:hypothetical protein